MVPSILYKRIKEQYKNSIKELEKKNRLKDKYKKFISERDLKCKL